jgi:hypothetical protein
MPGGTTGFGGGLVDFGGAGVGAGAAMATDAKHAKAARSTTARKRRQKVRMAEVLWWVQKAPRAAETGAGKALRDQVAGATLVIRPRLGGK